MEVAAFLADNGADIHDNDIGQFVSCIAMSLTVCECYCGLLSGQSFRT